MKNRSRFSLYLLACVSVFSLALNIYLVWDMNDSSQYTDEGRISIIRSQGTEEKAMALEALKKNSNTEMVDEVELKQSSIQRDVKNSGEKIFHKSR